MRSEAVNIKHVANSANNGECANELLFGVEQAKDVRSFHSSFPAYRPTDLKRLDCLAEKIGVKSLFVKDESSRFGLNAFKSLGGSYCVGELLAETAGVPEGQRSYKRLHQEDVLKTARTTTFVTATDGNHGRGIAWAAREFGASAVVYMPKGSSLERLDNIRALGAYAEITNLNYDDTVRFAAQRAEENDWILVQDTAWESYESIPMRIMKGYTTLGLELVEQLGNKVPTHIFLQAGVGSMAGALSEFFFDYYRALKPIIVVVEPNAADCVFRTAEANDGSLHVVKGDMKTIMAGLSCGEPCVIGWKKLRQHADHFISVPDIVAEMGMRLLANPVGHDMPIVSGESGAVTIGLVVMLMEEDGLFEIRNAIGLNSHSRVICISTEGDTDRKSYESIVNGNAGE